MTDRVLWKKIKLVKRVYLATPAFLIFFDKKVNKRFDKMAGEHLYNFNNSHISLINPPSYLSALDMYQAST